MSQIPTTKINTILGILEDGEEYAPMVNVIREIYRAEEGTGDREYNDMRRFVATVKQAWESKFSTIEFTNGVTNEETDRDHHLWDLTIGEELNTGDIDFEKSPPILKELLDALKDEYEDEYKDLKNTNNTVKRRKAYRRVASIVQFFSFFAHLYDAISAATRSHQEEFYNPLQRNESSKALETQGKRGPKKLRD